MAKLSAKETALRIERAVRSVGGPLAAWYARGQRFDSVLARILSVGKGEATPFDRAITAAVNAALAGASEAEWVPFTVTREDGKGFHGEARQRGDREPRFRVPAVETLRDEETGEKRVMSHGWHIWRRKESGQWTQAGYVERPAEPAATVEHRYGARSRPPGFGATPSGILRVDPPVPGQHATRYGVVVYGRKLTDKEVYDYELVPYAPLPEVVRSYLAALTDYGAEYAKLIREGEPLSDVFRGVLDEGPAFYTDASANAIARAVADALLAKYPAPPPVAPVAAPRSPFPSHVGPPKLSRMPSGFDGFDTGEDAEPSTTWQQAARATLGREYDEGEIAMLTDLLRPGETLPSVEPHVYVYTRHENAQTRRGTITGRALLLLAPAANSEASAAKIEAAFRRKRITRSKATGFAWQSHLSPTTIAGPTGTWTFAPEIDPDASRVHRKLGEGDTVTAAKERLLMAVRDAGVFTDAQITGSAEKGYTLHMRPRPTKKLRFAAESLRIRDWESAHEAVAEAARSVTAAIAKLTAES